MITQIAILGVIASLITEFIKKKSETNSLQAKLLAIMISMIVGSAYVLAKDTPFWPVIMSVLAISSTVYGLIIKQ